MKRVCFLHIGTEKTGTTSIQNFLSKNRSHLKKQEIIYPRIPGNQSHRDLTVYALGDERQSGGIRRHSGVSSSDQVPGFRERLRSKLDTEFESSRASTIIFSNENL